MKKPIFVLSLLITGLMTSCVEKYEEVPSDEKPSWLGASIYQELKNPNPEALTGTFNTYLRLVDDLEYAEILDRTGSKTVFPANDEAFERFFSNNKWGVSSYEQLTVPQKKLLLYSSMLDNALLVSMLSNVSDGATDVKKGMAIKHPTTVSVIDTISHITSRSQMPAYNPKWEKYHDRDIYVVTDNTKPQMVHFTREYMINQGITTKGPNSDFALITGSEYSDGMAYIFDNKIITKYPDGLTCQNGYVHQLENVLVPPGNLVDVLRNDENTSLFSRVLDYFSAPFYDKTTTDNYNSWALQNGKQTIDSIFQVRYFSLRSQGGQLNVTPDNTPEKNVLKFDPGWNGYYPAVSNNVNYDVTLVDIGTMLVPTNKAFEEYFLPGGNGEYLINIYGAAGKANTAENLAENLDSLHKKAPHVLTSFISNLQQDEFKKSVPSKFSIMTNDAAENMGLTEDKLNKKSDGKYNIKFANNGIIYVLDEMIAPDEYQSVMAPSSTYPDMRVMNWMVKDQEVLLVDYRFYLLAMSANYAFFIPEDSAFTSHYYVDPASLKRYPQLSSEGNGQEMLDQSGKPRQPQVIKFSYDGQYLNYSCYKYDPETQEVGELINSQIVKNAETGKEVKSVLVDILNYHTIVLKPGEELGARNYYKTKHGGEIYIDGAQAGNKVMSGAAIDNGMPAPQIKERYIEKNGIAYRLDRIIEAPQNSVYKTLVTNSDRFSEFLELCDVFSSANSEVLDWAGISSVSEDQGMTSLQERMRVFDNVNGTFQCLDQNVKFFNTYNYTLYAPNNEAMQKAYAEGLPNHDAVFALFEKYHNENVEDTDEVTPEELEDKQKAYVMLMTMRNFIRYHFQTVSIYADKQFDFDGNKAQTMSSDDLGVSLEVGLEGGDNQFVVTDGSKTKHVINAADNVKLVNKMTRDYWFDGNTINTTSFCVVHELSEPLKSSEGRFDTEFATSEARSKAAKKYQRLAEENKL